MKNKPNTSPEADLLTPNLKVIDSANSIVLALKNPLRQKILKILLADSQVPVNIIIKKTKGEQSSQHLGILREVKIVTTIRKGRSILYSINQRRLNYLISRIREMATD